MKQLNAELDDIVFGDDTKAIDLTPDEFELQLVQLAFTEMQKNPDVERRVAYWRNEARLINVSVSTSKKFFAELYGQECGVDGLVEMLAMDLAIPVEVLSEYWLDQMNLRNEFVQQVEEETRLNEEAAQAAHAEEVRRVEQEKEEARKAKEMARRSIQLFPVLTESDRKQKANGRTREGADAVKASLAHMSKYAGRRVLPDMSKKLKNVAALKSEFANFSDVIELVESDLLVSAHSKPEGFKVRPILMNGAPGIGKTAFAMRLAAELGLPYSKVSGGGMQNSAELCGTSKHWGNTMTGRVFDLLAKSEFGTAVLVIDEADKIRGGNDSFYQIVPSLLDLLEPESARIYEDQSLQVTFDASHLIVILTSNDTTHMDAALLSRCEVIEISEPTVRQRFVVGQKIFEKIIANLMNDAGKRKLILDEVALMQVAESDMDLRKLTKVMTNALAKALKECSQMVSPEVPKNEKKERFTIGFMP